MLRPHGYIELYRWCIRNPHKCKSSKPRRRTKASGSPETVVGPPASGPGKIGSSTGVTPQSSTAPASSTSVSKGDQRSRRFVGERSSLPARLGFPSGEGGIRTLSCGRATGGIRSDRSTSAPSPLSAPKGLGPRQGRLPAATVVSGGRSGRSSVCPLVPRAQGGTAG
jgi:hypothetical protein